MNFYKINKDYIRYAHSIDQYCIDSFRSIGVILRLNGYIYFLPVDGADTSDFDLNGELKKTTPTILRMIDMKTKNYLGKCLFSNMYPVPYNEITAVDLVKFRPEKIALLEKKLDYIQKNMSRIMKYAERLYKQKIKNYNQKYLLHTVDFKQLESACIEWEIQYYGKHLNRFPDAQYFLTNPYKDGITDYFLMNKTTKVALISMNNNNQKVEGIKKSYCEEYAPLECFKHGHLTPEAITVWFKGRGIPSWRDGLDDLLDHLGIESRDCLLNKAFGLSLSDHYWMNPAEMIMDWNDINFFEHDFNSKDYVEVNFENKILDPKQVDFFSPNNTSDGMLRKAWIVGENNKRYMLKGDYKHSGLEPFNEVLASMIAEVLDLRHVDYTLDIIGNTIVSRCECFIDKNTELLSAYAILKFYNVDLHENNEDVYQSYVKILKKHGLKDVESKLCKMFILDYLILNKDRHLGNFGVIRNVESLEWSHIAPNFDSGQAMYSQKEIHEMNFNHSTGSFFNKKDVDFEIILNKVMPFYNLEKIDFSKLYEVAEYWKSLLKEYQYITHMEEEKISCLYEGLIIRIEKLAKRQ